METLFNLALIAFPFVLGFVLGVLPGLAVGYEKGMQHGLKVGKTLDDSFINLVNKHANRNCSVGERYTARDL
jgi:hypothetical protein